MIEALNIDALREVIVEVLSVLGGRIAGFLPSLIGSLVILAIGWVIARLVQAAAGRILARAGLDNVSERLGLAETLREAGMERPASGVIARLFFWLLMMTFILSGVETLGLTAVTATIDRLIAYLPNIIAASLIVVLGLLLARFVGNLVASGAIAANMPYARALGSAARSVMIIMVVVLTLEQLGVDARLLLYALITVFATVGLGLGLSFALGSREVVSAILSGYYLRKSIDEGTQVTIDGRTGILERVGPADTLFRDGDATWSVPNARLLDSIIDRAHR